MTSVKTRYLWLNQYKYSFTESEKMVGISLQGARQLTFLEGGDIDNINHDFCSKGKYYKNK